MKNENTRLRTVYICLIPVSNQVYRHRRHVIVSHGATGRVHVRDRLALSRRRHRDVSAVLHQSLPKSTLDTSHATWTVNTSLRYFPSTARWSPLKCRRIATIPSSLADMLTSTLKQLMMPLKQCSTWTEVGRVFVDGKLIRTKLAIIFYNVSAKV